jgi:hypothetical protein
LKPKDFNGFCFSYISLYPKRPNKPVPLIFDRNL